MQYLQRYNEWLNSEFIDSTTKEELLQIKDNEAEIKERFFCDLEFGTGGLRGIIGAGTNRMNIYTVRNATQGIANYIKKFGQEAMDSGVAIAYDSRHFSKEFAEAAALIFNGNGIKSYIFDELTPTPMLSYAVRDLQAIAGIVITASHNPPEYNGYKVYWADGGQVVPEVANAIIEEAKKIQNFDQVKTISRKEAEQTGLFNIISPDLVTRFVENVKKQSLIDDSFRKYVTDLKVIYTPLHGTGNIPVRRVLRELGFTDVKVVVEQELPDSKFSTVKSPNPEDKDAFGLAIDLAKQEKPDLILGTDPDCDRIGVLEQIGDGEFMVLTGNQVGVLLSEYILARRSELNQLPANGVIIKTIVTTDMVNEIAADYRIKVLDTLTGFKFIGEKMREFEKTGEYQFLLGFEESYGYLIGTHARDKDAVVAAALICEMAAYYKSKGCTLYEQLLSLMDKYGYYIEDLKSIRLEGLVGQEKIKQIMKDLRSLKPEWVGLNQVVMIEDYLARERYDLITGKTTPLDLPKSNVLKFFFADKSSFAIRPSGTEPKIKIYLSVVGETMVDGKEKVQKLKDDVVNLLNC